MEANVTQTKMSVVPVKLRGNRVVLGHPLTLNACGVICIGRRQIPPREPAIGIRRVLVRCVLGDHNH